MFSGEDESKVTVDGYAQQYMTPFGGTEAVIGCVANVKFMGKKIVRELTTGALMAGADLIHQGELAQTTSSDLTNMGGAVALSSSRIVGARNTSTISAPAGRKLWLNFDTEISFSNKADSSIKYEVIKPGQSIASLTASLTASS